MRLPALALLFVALVGCSAGPTLMEVTPPPQSTVQSLYHMTTRSPVPGDSAFGAGRAAVPSFGQMSVGVPRDHTPGQVEVTDGLPDPGRHFYNAGLTRFAGPAQLTADINQTQRQTVVFIHGYNNTFAESAFRFAQILHDMDRDVTPILVSWASQGTGNGYAYDRDSALIARDDLADLVIKLSEDTNNAVTLAAHSMGSLVAVEALMQLSLRKERSALANIERVLLVAPDLEADLFADQMQQVSCPAVQIMIAVNQSDRALALSGRITGNGRRLGRDLAPAELMAQGYRVLDLSSITDGGADGHFLLASSPTLLEIVRAFELPDG